MNLNKIFPWLSIRYKLIIAFAGLSVLPVVLVGLHSIFSNVQMMKEIAYENLTHDVHTIRKNTTSFLSRVEGDLTILRNMTFLQSLLGGDEQLPDVRNPYLLKAVNEEVLSFMRTRNAYYQIRMIGEYGDEVFRVECFNPLDSARSFRIVKTRTLRHGDEAFYFLLTRELKSGEIVFAPAELRFGESDRVPVISFVTVVKKVGEKSYLLVANVFAKDFFTAVETGRHLKLKGTVIIVSHDGHYLYHSEKKTDWNRLLAAREEDNLQHDYAVGTAATVLSGKEGMITEGSPDIISYAPLFPNQGIHEGSDVQSAFALPFFVLESVPTDVILGPARSFAETFAAFLGLFLVVAVGLGLLATRQFTRPIAELQRGAEIISQGNYGHRLRVETHDEIESLAEQFNAMAVSLEEREKEIQRHRANLEEMVRQRTLELTEEKHKLQVILDNIPSAFILLDKELKIQTTSAAFAAVTGFHAQDVLQRDCGTVFCDQGFCTDCVARAAIRSGRIESHIDHIPEQSGTEDRYLEHIAIPMKSDGVAGSVIEIITDVTKRKQFEHRLIQAERLTAAGEMSAIIAHEFRNSLTSIKMILQLQRESKQLTRSDKKSLGVALNSIYHMELVVTELLNFARPTPMEFRLSSVLPLVEEALRFVELQMVKSHVELKREIDPALPLLRLDASHFKEALVNVLLNAIQAIDGKPRQGTHEHVTIAARGTELQQTIYEPAVPSMISESPSESGGVAEILLPAGTPCVVVEVRDTGPGISEEAIRRVFDPFFTTKVNGTGLGLPLVKRTVHAHGGVVKITSRKGQGTTFTMIFPLP